MARQARKTTKKAAAAPEGAQQNQHGNGYDPDAVQAVIGQIVDEWDKLDSLRADYMNKCKGPRGAINEIKSDAKDSLGISSKALNELLKDEADLRKIVKREKARRAKGDGIEDEIDQLRLAAGQLSDTPFGQWLSDQVS